MARKPKTASQKVAKLEKQIKNLKAKVKDKSSKREYKMKTIQNKRQWLDTKAQHKYKKRAQKIEKLKVMGERQGKTARSTVKAGVAAQGITETGMTIRGVADANLQASKLINAGATNVNEAEDTESSNTYEDIYGGLG